MARISGNIFRAAAVAASLWGMVSPAAAAAPLSATELADLFQSAGNIVDLSLLPFLTTPPAGLSYAYASTATDSSWANWSGALNGSYGLQPLSLLRSNGQLNDAAGTTSWTTAGTLGAGAVTGAASGSIAYPTGSTFALTFTDSLSLGGNTATVHLSFSGTILSPSSFMLGSPGNPGSGNGTVTVNGYNGGDFWPDPPIIFWTINPDGSISSEAISTIGGKQVVSHDLLPPPETTFTETSVPEPATWTILLLGFGGLGVLGRRRAVFALDRSAPPLATERRRET